MNELALNHSQIFKMAINFKAKFWTDEQTTKKKKVFFVSTHKLAL